MDVLSALQSSAQQCLIGTSRNWSHQFITTCFTHWSNVAQVNNCSLDLFHINVHTVHSQTHMCLTSNVVNLKRIGISFQRYVLGMVKCILSEPINKYFFLCKQHFQVRKKISSIQSKSVLDNDFRSAPYNEDQFQTMKISSRQLRSIRTIIITSRGRRTGPWRSVPDNEDQFPTMKISSRQWRSAPANEDQLSQRRSAAANEDQRQTMKINKTNIITMKRWKAGPYKNNLKINEDQFNQPIP